MMEVCMNNNTTKAYDWNAPTASRPKRDFRIQVIEVASDSPRYFIFPNRNRGSHEEIDENHNRSTKTNTKTVVEGASLPTSSNAYPQYQTLNATQNGYRAMRRSILRQSKRKQLEGADAPSRTASEPAPRRLSLKKEKASTEPINGPSNTFKILSIAKKWESFDATDDELDSELTVSCKTLCLDDTDRRKTAPV